MDVPRSPTVRRRSSSFSANLIPSASVPTVVFTEGDSDHPHPSVADDRIVIIWLTTQEEKLFQTLMSAADAFSSGSIKLRTQSPHSIEVRVAGGWVRDKILGLQTHDVDIAIDTISGVEFATVVQTYLQQHAPEEVHKMGVIAANPSQSKHLETATMDVYGIDVDFSNLRSQEVYLPGSRIPTTQFGSPKEDAERRDFTINALFFNLRTDQVEDWTGRGLRDLRSGIIETPLNPHTTFHDDPLRVLRAIRFAVRYDFRLHDDLQKACLSQEVLDSLHLKVSRERVGKELEGMLSGKGAKPAKALDTIDHLRLTRSVFCLPDGMSLDGSILGRQYTKQEEDRLIELGWEESRMLLTQIPCVYDAHLEAMESLDLPADATRVNDRLFHLAVFVMPFRHLAYLDTKGKSQLAVAHMFRDGVKFKNKDIVNISTIVETVEAMMSILEGASEGDIDAPLIPSRLDLGLLLRRTKEHWVTVLLVATILKLREQTVGRHWTRQLQRLYCAILEMKLDHCWKLKPLLNGRDLIQTFELPPGPGVGQYLTEEIRWMLMHPVGTRADCIKHLLKFKRDMEHRQAMEREQQQAAKKLHVAETHGDAAIS